MTLEELTELIEQTDDPDVAQTLLDEYNRTHSEPWDEWNPDHADNLLSTVMWESVQAGYELSREPNGECISRMVDLYDQLDAAEGDMPLWCRLCMELRKVALNGLTVPIPSDRAAQTYMARLDAAMWNRQHGVGSI